MNSKTLKNLDNKFIMGNFDKIKDKRVSSPAIIMDKVEC